MNTPRLTLRFGASANHIEAGGNAVTRNSLSNAEQARLRDALISNLFTPEELQKDPFWRQRKRIRQEEAQAEHKAFLARRAAEAEEKKNRAARRRKQKRSKTHA